MKARVIQALDKLTALYFSSWGWLTPRAKFYKASAWSVLVLLILALIDQAFVLPALEGWLAVVSLAGALTIATSMIWRWSTDDSVDVPREWIAPVGSRGRGKTV